jgi:hypothetical protein
MRHMIGDAHLAERRERMKWYVLTLFLLVGFVWSVSAQQIDSKLNGTWESTDGTCRPCTLSIQEGGKVSFMYGAGPMQVTYVRGTPEPGIDVILEQGGKLDLKLNKKGTYLLGTYTSWDAQFRKDYPVSFERK